MIKLLISDLNKQMAQHDAVEKQAQADYELTMQESSKKRKADMASTQDKITEKADSQSQLQKHEDADRVTTKELAMTLQYINSLHAGCDFIDKYFTIRKDHQVMRLMPSANSRLYATEQVFR